MQLTLWASVLLRYQMVLITHRPDSRRPCLLPLIELYLLTTVVLLRCLTISASPRPAVPFSRHIPTILPNTLMGRMFLPADVVAPIRGFLVVAPARMLLTIRQYHR